jgi:hypothetical protein
MIPFHLHISTISEHSPSKFKVKEALVIEELFHNIGTNNSII